MGNGCGSRRLTPDFTICRVKSISEGQIKLSSPVSSLTLPHPSSPLLKLDDPAFCLLRDSERIVTFPTLIPDGTVGKVYQKERSFCYFEYQENAKAVFPAEFLTSSFDTDDKPANAVFLHKNARFIVKITMYNPFAHRSIINAAEERVLSRGRDPLISVLDRHRCSDRQLKLLGQKYAALRRIRNDGNTLYRCVFVQFLEHLCRKTTPVEELSRFIGLIDSQVSYYALLPEYREFGTIVSSVLHKLQTLKLQRLNEELPTLQWILQDSSVDLSFINFFRMLIANFIALHYKLPRFKRFIISEIKEVVLGVLKLGLEAEGLVKYAIPDLLGVVLVQEDVSVSPEDVFETYYAPADVGKYPLLHVFKTATNSYDILYSIESQTIDGYDLSTHAYDICDVQDSHTILASQLYQSVLPSELHAIQT